jgi:hypothetical protein
MCKKQNKTKSLPDLHMTKLVSIGMLLVVYVGPREQQALFAPFLLGHEKGDGGGGGC